MYNMLETLERTSMKTILLEKSDIDKVVDLLASGEIVALATDTVMGLAIISDNLDAYNKLIEVKNRPLNKLFPIMVSDIKMLEKTVKLNRRDKLLAKSFYPGKITFIFNLRDDSNIVFLDNSVAVRIVEDEFICEVVRRLNKPIFLTSANKSGENTTMYYSEVLEIFDGEIAGVLKMDAFGYKSSSIFDLSKDEITVIRKGDISLDAILLNLKRSCLDE